MRRVALNISLRPSMWEYVQTEVRNRGYSTPIGNGNRPSTTLA
jgi:hypothetical protein